jgi:N,N'-diacetyllegionaminate synthase
MYKKVYIIGEAGVNHNGKVKNAFKLVDIAKKAGVDAVKFQTFLPGELTGKFTKNANYIKKNITNLKRSELTKKLALPFSDFIKINNYCKKKKITFLSTPDGERSLDFLVKKIKIPIIKIGSTELTNLEFLDLIAQQKRKVILSTGMGNLKDVIRAFNVIKKKIKKKIILMQCTTEYPAPLNEMNINVVSTYKKIFKCEVGLSDHSLTFESSIAAVAMGAKYLEKHFTINKKMHGPDHKASLNPKELIEYVRTIRNTEKILGSNKKEITKSEYKNINSVRRGIVAKNKIKKGTILKKEMLTFKRPFVGIHPYEIKKIIGKKTKYNLLKDTVFRINDFN